MGPLAIAIWMLVILPIGIIAAGYLAALGFDLAFARINRSDEDGDEPEESPDT